MQHPPEGRPSIRRFAGNQVGATGCIQQTMASQREEAMIYKPMHLIFRATINPSNWEQEHATTLADRRSGSDRLVADSCDHGSPNLAAHVFVGAGTCCHVWDEHEVPMGVMLNH